MIKLLKFSILLQIYLKIMNNFVTNDIFYIFYDFFKTVRDVKN
jgi:hypothetical protein